MAPGSGSNHVDVLSQLPQLLPSQVVQAPIAHLKEALDSFKHRGRGFGTLWIDASLKAPRHEHGIDGIDNFLDERSCCVALLVANGGEVVFVPSVGNPYLWVVREVARFAKNGFYSLFILGEHQLLKQVCIISHAVYSLRLSLLTLMELQYQLPVLFPSDFLGVRRFSRLLSADSPAPSAPGSREEGRVRASRLPMWQRVPDGE